MNKPMILRFSALLLFVVIVLTLVISCGEKKTEVMAPTAMQDAETFGLDNRQIQAVMAVQDRETPALMKMNDVVGTATGLTDDGQPAILVFVKTDEGAQALKKSGGSGKGAIPASIESIPLVVQVTGEFKAMDGEFKPLAGKPGGSGSTVSHTAKQTPPIQLGTSGGWGLDLANGYCCGGTLGSLIQINGVQYILSNYHVFESDIISGGNNIVAETGNPIIQPGLIDVGCNAANAQKVATLVKSSSLPGNNVDASIAQVVPGMVSASGAILEIGTISTSTVNAAIRKAVKKSGRTTGLTRSTVSGLNATISVAYDNECAGGAAFTKTFTGQIVIANRASKFLAGGDSGSLMVEDVTTNPRAVGLLFAGSSTSAIANPIGQVLNFFGATMVGN
jgi:hypothetical protein